MSDAPYSPYIDRLGLDWDGNNPDDVAVAEGLDVTLTNLTSHVTALAYFDLDEEAADGWEDTCYGQLLDMLTAEQLAKAVIALMMPFAHTQACGLVYQFRDLPEPDQHRRDTT